MPGTAKVTIKSVCRWHYLKEKETSIAWIRSFSCSDLTMIMIINRIQPETASHICDGLVRVRVEVRVRVRIWVGKRRTLSHLGMSFGVLKLPATSCVWSSEYQLSFTSVKEEVRSQFPCSAVSVPTHLC